MMKRISALLIVLLTASVSVLFAQETHAQWKAEVEQLDKNLYRVSMTLRLRWRSSISLTAAGLRK